MEKVKQIKEELQKEKPSIEKLKIFCQTEDGLVNNEIRKKVWPILLEIDENSKDPVFDEEIFKHHYADQIEKDVDRSLYKLTDDMMEKRKSLSRIINKIFKEDDTLHYFQGYHDICSVFLLVCGENLAYKCLKKLSYTLLKEVITSKDFDLLLRKMDTIFITLKNSDPKLSEIFVKTNHEKLHFAFPWVLTWFSHEIDDFQLVTRLFDLFLSNFDLLKYLTIVIIMSKKEELLQLDEIEFGKVFKTFKSIQITEKDIKKAVDWFNNDHHSNTPNNFIMLSIVVVAFSIVFYQFIIKK